MHRVNTPETNIMTAEDPVEFNLHGINQVQMKEQIGLNFAAALRVFLRQDPNIVLVGEIRDFETAEIAVKAALTGHLVLSTLHTNDAPVDDQPPDEHGHRAVPGGHLGQPDLRPAAGAPHLQGVQGGDPDADAGPGRRRLLRRRRRRSSCTRAAAAANCNNTGYRGRVGLYEVMEISEEIRELVLSGASAMELRRKAIEEGMISLRLSGLAEDQGRGDHRRRSGPRDRALGRRTRYTSGRNATVGRDFRAGRGLTWA